MRKLLLALSFIMIVCANVSWASCTKWDVIEADNRWGRAIDSNMPRKVVDLYAEKAVLVPTVGLDIFTTQEERLTYFAKLFILIKDLTVDFEEDKHIKFVPGGAVSSGFYHFRGRSKYDGDVHIPARYTFVYKMIKKEDDLQGCYLRLITHHSSETPFGNNFAQLMSQ